MKVTKGKQWWLRVGVAAWFAVPGCVATKCSYNDIPAGAVPVCTGTHTKEIFRKQAEIAEADDFVIYEHEWLFDPLTGCGTARPGPYGSYHLTHMAKRLPEVPFPVLIQVNINEKLNEDRRQAVVQYLLANGILDADTRVILGFPEAEGLHPEEGPGIYHKGYISRWYLGNNQYDGVGFGGGYGGVTGVGVVGGLGGIGGSGGFGNLGGLRRY